MFALAGRAAAQDKPDAQILFDEGKRLMTVEHRFAEACAKLAESNRLEPELGTLLWLGGCYEKIGRNASAWAAFQSAAELAGERHDEREAVAREHMASVESLLFKVTIAVPPNADLPDLEVRRDGTVVPRASWANAVALDAGPHVITASAPQRRTWEKSVEVPLTGGAVTVTVPRLEPMQAVQVVPVENRGKDREWLIAGWMVAGVGLVGGVALGAGFGLDAKSKLDASNGPPYDCVPSTSGHAVCASQGGADLRNAALSSALGSTIAFVAGGALLATGLVIALAAPSVTLRMAPSATGMMTALEGTF